MGVVVIGGGGGGGNGGNKLYVHGADVMDGERVVATFTDPVYGQRYASMLEAEGEQARFIPNDK